MLISTTLKLLPIFPNTSLAAATQTGETNGWKKGERGKIAKEGREGRGRDCMIGGAWEGKKKSDRAEAW